MARGRSDAPFTILFVATVSRRVQDGLEDKYALLYAVFKDLLLFRAHWEHAVKGEAILLWALRELRVLELDGLEVLVESDDDVSALPELERVRWTEAGWAVVSAVHDCVVPTDRQTTFIFVDAMAACAKSCRASRSVGQRGLGAVGIEQRLPEGGDGVPVASVALLAKLNGARRPAAGLALGL